MKESKEAPSFPASERGPDTKIARAPGEAFAAKGAGLMILARGNEQCGFPRTFLKGAAAVGQKRKSLEEVKWWWDTIEKSRRAGGRSSNFSKVGAAVGKQ